jgi:putative DNA methylase
MDLGTYIRRYRQEANLPLRKLAQLVRVNPAYLSRVERGLVPPSDALVRALAEVIEVEFEDLLLLSGRIPESWQPAIMSSPARAVETLRTALADCVAESTTAHSRTIMAFTGTRTIEDESFPFEHLSDIAELESWRKEINRPVYHIHKWWAQRLGSVFRAILLGIFAPKGSNLLQMFYQPARLPGAVIFDPFMGSGTTIGEALKLGARAIGRDINPVSHFMVRNALGVHPCQKIVATFKAIERDIAPAIRPFYQARFSQGGTADVLYYFWVKVVRCPACERPVDLFSSYIFARHTYAARYPSAQALCPHCGAINRIRYDSAQALCFTCRQEFIPKVGPANGAKATCPSCGKIFSIAKTIQARGEPPAHRLYAKMVLLPNGTKEYFPIDDHDLALYKKASLMLRQGHNSYPVAAIEPGHNTNQVLNYGYTHWHQMFNDRQLLCLSLLAERIKAIPDENLRALFTCLFSGTLEFNNMFASYKGKGTGAVRHMFSHHILKPERTPLEANLWGTSKSSGAFSTLFASRLLRALDYCENPFEIRVTHKHGKTTGEKVYALSCALGYDIGRSFAEFRQGRQLYISCGDSADTDLAAKSVDAVVTDPPFFDNVHYSELADFFYVWQSYILGENGDQKAQSTRSPYEVQQRNPSDFTDNLSRVWRECHRILRADGLLVFTYHHSRAEGWQCILEAIVKSGFGIVATHPIKAEMSVAAPKSQARDPIDLDVILVCRKRDAISEETTPFMGLVDGAAQEAATQIFRLNTAGRSLSRNDVRVVFMAQIIKRLSWQASLAAGVRSVSEYSTYLESAISRIYACQEITEASTHTQTDQLTLW